MIRLRCERMVHGGLCIAHDEDGAVVLVDAAIPGELVDAELRFRKGKVSFATARDVIEPDPDRVVPPCRYVPECGGCQWQHIAYPRQLTLKREVVLDALARQHVPAPAEIPVHGMDDPWRYRRRGEFHVVPGHRGVADAELGFNRARSWRPIAIDDCLIHAAAITDSMASLRELARRSVGEAGSPLTVVHVTAGDGIELLVRGKPRSALPAEVVDDVAAHAEARARFAIESTTLHWRGHAYRVTPATFIQVNWMQMDVLYECALHALGDVTGLRVVDAYAGIGVLSVHLAATAEHVICIESNREAARMGVLNARLNEVGERLTYMPEPVERALPRLAGVIDCLVLDPPRAGCESAVSAWLALTGPERIAYVSCDPATLARDLHVLVASGPYELCSLEIVDMFPQTHHVESVACLQRRAV
ncbi:MAG: class I SAM-dependent RNA methyltransferase [Candidatus Dormibacteraeota bacterium]|nr:class I SAM-dependent RNA methyltransferase [Candidatus Dormibacteraeota bacterium]